MEYKNMLQRAPQPEKLEKDSTIIIPTDVLNTIQAVKYDPKIKATPMYMRDFVEDYKKLGKDIVAEFAKRPKSLNTEGIRNDFLGDREGSLATNLSETLPLYANVEGRLGEYIQVSVTKTAKEDDQGNSFIDLIIEVKNKWLANGAPKELQDVPEKMTFLVDITTAESGKVFENKMGSFKDKMLLYGERANVMCYRDANGNVGIERPKILVKQNANNLEKFGTKLGECITRTASDRFSINRPNTFDKLYREYFSDLMTAIAENAASNSAYIKSLEPDAKRLALAREYDKIVKFVEVYKKTPVTKAGAR